jgi:hypothetical protein
MQWQDGFITHTTIFEYTDPFTNTFNEVTNLIVAIIQIVQVYISSRCRGERTQRYRIPTARPRSYDRSEDRGQCVRLYSVYWVTSVIVGVHRMFFFVFAMLQSFNRDDCFYMKYITAVNVGRLHCSSSRDVLWSRQCHISVTR